jgi:HlyD family secretion protein
MTAVYYRSRKGLSKLFEDHGPEAISMLTAEPSKMMRATILVLVALIVAAVVWSFFGKVDVMVQASGIVNPESEQLDVYVPIKGELVDVYVSEGMPVAKGDVMVRVNSPSAIELAGQATQAQVHLAAAERGHEMFPVRKKATQKEIEALKAKIAAEEEASRAQSADSIAKLSEEQRLKLEKARAKLAKANEERDQARRVVEQHERLFKSPGGGGISREQVEEKRKTLNEKNIDYRLAEAELGEFEVALGQEYEKRKDEMRKKSQDLLALQSQYENMLVKLVQDEEQVETELRLARSKARSASRVSYDDIDEDNNLRIRAPESGIVTTVTYNHVGGQIDDKTPVASIALKGARKVLEVEINERDRAFLVAGMPVKIKLNAFPYQRYGVLKGELEHIAPSSTVNQTTKQIVYKARIGLERDYFVVNKVKTPVRYGMAANAEIVVSSRRLVDFATEPFKSPLG